MFNEVCKGYMRCDIRLEARSAEFVVNFDLEEKRCLRLYDGCIQGI